MSNQESGRSKVVRLEDVRIKREREKSSVTAKPEVKDSEIDSLRIKIVGELGEFASIQVWDDNTRVKAYKTLEKYKIQVESLERKTSMGDNRVYPLIKILEDYQRLFDNRSKESGFNYTFENAVYIVASANCPSNLNSVLSESRTSDGKYPRIVQLVVERSGQSRRLIRLNLERLAKARREALKGFVEYADLYREYGGSKMAKHLKLFALIGFSSYLNTIDSKYSYDFMLGNKHVMDSVEDVKSGVDEQHLFKVNALISRTKKKLEELKDRFGK